ncbi:MAG: hypothetical protein QOE61_975 [Micromonosporaceae bacterium]|jgi:type VII secretion-associated serine protease mycosin|nr:hypothetical protein [Micromonosporaceae bacterium]
MRSRWLAATLAGLVFTVGVGLVGTPAQAAPNTVREGQWYLGPLKIVQAQQITRGAGVVVAVLDTAIDESHPDLAGQVLPGYGIAGAPANGWSSDAGAMHGTAMASLIAGKGGGDMHLLGIAPEAKILPVAVGTFNTKTSGQGIRWAADHGAKVINVSSGGAGQPLSEEIDAVRYALSKDAVVVASSGNTTTTGPGVASPASIPGVVAVSGLVQSGNAWEGAGHGPAVVVAAPAIDIVNAVPTAFAKSGYGLGDGTSDSAAITSGVVALIRAKYPKLNAANVINRLIKTAKDNGDPGRDPIFGFGTIRPLDALTDDVPQVSQNPLNGDPSATASAAASNDSGYQLTPSGRTVQPGVVLALAGAAVVLVIVVIVLVLAARSRRHRRPGPSAGALGSPYPTGGAPPPGYGAPPPHGYPAPPPQGYSVAPGRGPVAPPVPPGRPPTVTDPDR